MRAPLRLVALWAVALAAGAWFGGIGAVEPTELRFLSVGQGDCAVFRHAGLTVLIDVGPALRDHDTAAVRIAKDLREMGVHRVDLALLSHPDSDHIGGLRGLSRLVPIAKVAAMRHFRRNRDLDEWLSAAHLAESDVLWLERGATLELGGYRAEVDAAPYAPSDPDNHGSMFLRLHGGSAAADFTGDADSLAELAVMRDMDWSAQVLKAGHHGSATATGAAWLGRVHPAVVVISCGRNNPYGHPAKAALNRIRASGAEIARTDTDGDIVFEVQNGKFERIR